MRLFIFVFVVLLLILMFVVIIMFVLLLLGFELWVNVLASVLACVKVVVYAMLFIRIRIVNV